MSYTYKFVQWDVPPKVGNEITQLLEKAQDKQPLTREEKDRIADILWGTFGSQSPTYKLMGYAWPMANYLPRILVKRSYNNHFDVYWAPDKTALRKCLTDIDEMVYA